MGFCIRKERFKFFCRNRRGKNITLHDITASFFHHLKLLLRFHSFRYYQRAKMPGDFRDNAQHVLVFSFGSGILCKSHVQLQHIKGQRGKHVERRISRPEVVHLD